MKHPQTSTFDIKEERNKKIARTQYKDSYWLIWQTDFNIAFKRLPRTLEDQEELKNDIQVILETTKGKRLGDAICHYGSYGVEKGLWETLIEGIDDVTGHLTFKEVLKQFDAVIRRYEKKL